MGKIASKLNITPKSVNFIIKHQFLLDKEIFQLPNCSER